MSEEWQYSRIQYRAEQVAALERVYSSKSFIDNQTRNKVAQDLGVKPKQIQVIQDSSKNVVNASIISR